jgi:hypothetical protein
VDQVHNQTVSQLHQVLIGDCDLKETCLGQSGFSGLHFTQCVHVQLLFSGGGVSDVCHPAAGVHGAVQNTRTSSELECTPRWQMPQYRHSGNTDTEACTAEIRCYAITNKYPEAACAAQQVYKVLSDIENLAGRTPTKVGKSSKWISIMNSA